MRARLDIAYDGTDFSGWAVQPERRTVAGSILAVLEQVLGAGVATGLTVAGRTDAGVHATGQVAHVDLPDPVWAATGPTLLRRLAGLLPGDVRVTALAEAPPEFDARFSATFRRYEYRVTDAPWGAEPLRRRDTLAWPRSLDLERLNAAAEGLHGEHDFAAFCKRKENATTVREVTRLEWHRVVADGVLVATVQADAFCQAMVRSLVGAMLVAGDGRRPPEWPASQLTRRERSSAVTVAPPHGLALVAVGYPEEPGALAARANATRRLRTPAS
ncbi:tRNA pseudouridine(38-40) synthase TruA [Asanoa ishikariensis]|uniref:tRNA pseudouridine(38-40) synthase TruA n=1 Tax=Asanoa ishikariensis TaxID=137265 RepID=UPI001EF2F932|nr:tRNA pseudouridine(38-40) synthase TruA [Asanoa ishikariensis]